jgi:hypothetical protein
VPNYWFDVFTPETWKEAQAAGLTVTGFSETKRRTADRIRPGDVLLCYLKGHKKLAGALRATAAAYFAREPRIWKGQDFPVRVPVEAIVAFNVGDAMPVADLLPSLTFYDPTSAKRTWARFQGSPTKLREDDGNLLMAALRREPPPPVLPPPPPTRAVVAAKDEARKPSPVSLRLGSPIDRLVGELTTAQRDAAHPGRLEQAATDALKFLGFDARRVGGAGETDIIADSPLGHDRFRAVIDTKASGSGRVPEGQINWPAIAAHRQRRRADHAAVFGERFAGGNLQKFAGDFTIALVDSTTLTEVLRLHAATPFPASDLRPLFSAAGPLTEVVADLRQKSAAVERHWQLVAEIIRLADRFARAELPLALTSGYLYAVLVDRALSGSGEKLVPPSEQDVRDAVAFLSCRAVGVLRAVDPETAGYRLTMSMGTALQRLTALRGSIDGMLSPREDAQHPTVVASPSP